MPEIKKTKNYALFKMHPNNRKIDQTNLSNITKSLQINNLLPFRPISVNDKMEILDGQHRFLAAKQLDLEVYYQINEEAKDEDIILLNANQKRWQAEDYVNYFASKGVAGFIQIQKFSKLNGMSTPSAMKVMRSTSGESFGKLKKGVFNPLPEEEIASLQISVNMAKEVIGTIGRYASEPMTPYNTDRCLRALMRISRLDGYEHEDMKSKIVKMFDKIRPCRTETDYFNLFLEIYNFGRKTKKLEE